MSRQIKLSPTLLPDSPSLLTRRWIRFCLLGVVITAVAIAVLLAETIFARTTITIDVNGSVREVRTDAPTVQEALQDAGILIDAADKVSPPLQTRLNDNMTISVVKAHQLVLEMSGDVRRVYTHVSDPLVILTEQGIQLGTNDV